MTLKRHPADYQSLKDQFLLNPGITFLNFGSFGACPRPVFEDYQRWQRELEYEPVQFMAFRGAEYLRNSREALAGYLHCHADDIVYVTNPSYAINIVAKSMRLSEGDEILATDIEYGACDRAWDFYCGKAGARYVRQRITLPLTTSGKFAEDFFKGFSPRTKAVFISHITSTTGVILPVEKICEEARRRGVMTIVDGAHVPGHIPLDLSRLRADFYTGACHKWMMTAKGCSFLYARKEMQEQLEPLVVSWGYKSMFPSASTFLDHHQMQGTRDFSAFLTVPAALKFMRDNHWPEVSSHCRQMLSRNAGRFCALLSCEPLAPLTEEFFGQMFSMQIRTEEPEKLQKELYTRHRIEIPVMRQDDKVFLRFSLNAFNTEEDLDRLYEALQEIISEQKLLFA